MPNSYYTYIMTNQSNTTLYVGVTNDISRRAIEHIGGCGASFTSRYKINKLIYFERYTEITDAIKREKQLKGWRREKKGEPHYADESIMEGSFAR